MQFQHVCYDLLCSFPFSHHLRSQDRAAVGCDISDLIAEIPAGGAPSNPSNQEVQDMDEPLHVEEPGAPEPIQPAHEADAAVEALPLFVFSFTKRHSQTSHLSHISK